MAESSWQPVMGAAQRRRQRRLRSWWRHEQQSIAAALAAATHHSAQQNGALRSQKTATRASEEAGSETYHAPRGPKTLPPGTRPAPPPEVAGPQGAAATAGYVAAPGPLLVVASLAGGDEVDATTVSYLLKAALKLKKYEEEEKERKWLERRQVLLKEFFALADVPLQHRSPQQVSRLEALAKTLDDDLAAHPSQPSRRKRKKRRKRRLPRSSVPRGGRARRRQRQRRVFGSPGFDVPRAVFPSLVVRPRILGILAGMDQKDICKVLDIPVMRGETCTHSANCAEDRRSCRCCSWTVPPPGIGGVGFGLSPNHDTKHTFYEFCLPSERGCVAMLCGGRFCSSDGAYDSVWDRVKPMTGNFHLLFPVSRVRLVYLHAEFLVQQQRRDLRRQLLLYPVQVDGHLSQCEVGAVSVRRYDHQGGP